MMDWYGNGMGGGGSLIWVFMVMFWVALIALVVFLVVKLLPGSTGHVDLPTASNATAVEAPEQVLDRMFAMGEIDEQTYRARRAALTEMRKPS
jgi:putative membrane protein